MYAQRLTACALMNIARRPATATGSERGVVLIAPGSRHLQLRRSGQYFRRVPTARR